MTGSPTTIDWPRLLEEIAYALGEPEPCNPEIRVPCPETHLAVTLRIARTTLRGWRDGSEPRHGEGERVLELWCRLTNKSRAFAPRCKRPLSAAEI